MRHEPYWWLLVFCTACAASAPLLPSSAGKPPVSDDLPNERRELNIQVAEADSEPGATLACGLLLPPRKNVQTRVAAVIILRGSGPSSRDYNALSSNFDLPRLLAERLAAAGVASLRCDARGSGRSTGQFWRGTFATYVRDAQAMLNALKQHDAIDASRLAVLGHSEGGIVAKVVAHQDPAVRALGLLAAGGSDFRQAVLKQKEDELARAGLSEAETRGTRELIARSLDAIAGAQPLPSDLPPAMRTMIEEMTPWLRSRLAHDTRAMTRNLRALPILIAQGTSDWLTPAQDAEIQRADLATGHNPRATVRIYPGLNHHFAPKPTTDLPGAAIDGAFVQDVVSFTVGALGA